MAKTPKPSKRVVVLTRWGPYTTQYKLDCGHWVTRKTLAGVPKTMECDQCYE